MEFRRFVPILLLMLGSSLFGQEKVAVLNAVVGEGVSPNAGAIVADKINEQFVDSIEYTAIDRAYISAVQAEKSFQLSGEVKEADIKELGTTFGADYICQAYVGLLGSTYSVSARLIEVETAEVVLQESHRMKGDIDVLFTIAEIVGANLVTSNPNTGEAVAVADAVSLKEEAGDDASAEEAGTAEPAEPEASRRRSSSGYRYPLSRPRKHFVFSWMFPGYLGDTSPVAVNGYSLYEQDDALSTGYLDAWKTNYAVDYHMMFPLARFLYMGGGFTFTYQWLGAEDAFGTYSWDNFLTFEPYLTFGGVVSFFEIFQVYGGLSVGVMILTLGNSYGDDASNTYWGSNAGESAAGFSLGFELGISAWLGIIGVDLRYKLSKSPKMSGEVLFSDAFADSGGDASFGHHGLTVGLGFLY